MAITSNPLEVNVPKVTAAGGKAKALRQPPRPLLQFHALSDVDTQGVG